MTAQNTNDPAWAPIPISPIKGLKADATADTPENYQSLNTQATYYGVYRPGGFYVWTTEKPEIAKIVNGANEQTYSSLANAVQDYNDEGYIQMIADSTEPGFTLVRDVILDLNGKTVKLVGGLTVAEGKTLYGMDSSTGTGYVTAPRGKIVGTVNGTVAPVFEKTLTDDAEYNYLRYVAIENEEGTEYTFHRFNISVSGYRFELATGDTPQCALFFIGKFQGDAEAKAYLSKLGFTLKDNNNNLLGKADYEFTADTVIPEMPADGKESTSEVVRSGDAFLFEVYLKRSFDKAKPDGYTKKISATAQATFKNNGTQDSEPKQWSFEDAWKNAEGLTSEQQEILNKFLTDLGINQ